ncbi:MAG: GMC family oxidoreductase [Pseudomonadota bacterium]|nr:GMC family oxidoreductase [Pseudomonadota bacterium]
MRGGFFGFEGYPAHMELEADVCVIGSGAGGSATAAALAERGLRVIVLEEGRRWAPEQFQGRAPWAFKHLYAGRGTRATRGNAIIPLPGGRGVGGSTLINSAICFRTPAPVLAEWRGTFGCHHLTDEWMGGCFDRIWRTIGVTVNPPEVQRNNNHIFRQGAEALGLDGAWMARSAPGCQGCGTCQQGCSTGGKLSVDRTFLAEAVLTGLVAVHADCRVVGVETQGDRVLAVTGRTVRPQDYADEGTFRVRARAFVSSAGPVGSPRFLMANGLSDGPVGQNLHVHPTAGVAARFDQEIVAWQGVTQGYYVDCWRDGYLLQTFSMPPDQYFLSFPLVGDEMLAFMRDLRHYASAGVVVHDEDSVGAVTESSLVYDLGDLDRTRILAGLRASARVFFAAGAKEVVPGAHGVGIIRSVEEIETVLHDNIPAHDIALYASHPMGTCRMGNDPARSVVDPDGRVWGWQNLHVADASVFPTSLGVNPQVTVMALGLTIGREVQLA